MVNNCELINNMGVSEGGRPQVIIQVIRPVGEDLTDWWL